MPPPSVWAWKDQVYHPYVTAGTPNMMNSTCRHSVLLPIEWHTQLSKDHPYGISLKALYDTFLLPLHATAGHPYIDVVNWWRHATTRTMPAGARGCLGLQVSMAQALLPALRANHDGWTQEQIEHLFKPLRAVAPPHSSAAFEAGMQLLRTDLATHHAASEARELAQHTDQEVQEDR